MSTLKADTIQSTGGGAATLTKQNTIKVFYDSKTTFGTADKSFGISSSSDVSTGVTGLNFTNSFDGSFYVAAGMVYDADGNVYNDQVTKSSSSCRIIVFGGYAGGGSGSALDKDIEIMITGDLA